MIQPNHKIMEKAIQLAREGYERGGQAVGAIVVKDDEIIAEDFTTVIRDKDSTCHAEMNAMRKAMKNLNSQRLTDCYLYTTYEPCPMCISAAIWAKLAGIIYGASSEDRTEDWQWRIHISAKEVIEHGEPKLELYSDFMREECKELLTLKLPVRP